ncbi:ThiF family adenylyltransferase [Paenibacillus kribbensis]|uniref:ThiF family adenylyltransferase n=1 Tax=Paenibacillus kribbensis TaxID=172713 RepID=UPI0008388C36|nr:ThiF family adenylyltransferase [Paenibacillus kribbensis]
MINSVPERINTGCIQLEIMDGYQQLEEVYWFARLKSWVLHFSLKVSGLDINSSIPQTTQWYMLIDPLYPRGSISIFPDKVNSITLTYKHMNENIEKDYLPWRLGKICTDWDTGQLELLSDSDELMDEEQRINWHVQRLKEWLLAASIDSLAIPGDYFELPHSHFEPNFSVVFAEEQKHIQVWNETKIRSGHVSLKEIHEYRNILFVSVFFGEKSEVIHAYDWGKLIRADSNKLFHGVWVLLPFQPIIQPWSYPRTFRELETICKEHHFDLWNEIYERMNIFRLEDRNFLLIGFQIPKLVGGENSIVHWISFEIGRLTKNVKKIKGFRKAKDYYFLRDRLNQLKPERKLKYVRTENWSKEAILSRGSLDEKVQRDGAVLIGAGALGSAIGELLSRTGISRILVCDEDILKPGNLSRHTLGINHLYLNKAEALSNRINHNNMHVWSSAINEPFPNLSEDEVDVIEGYDVIIDTTGSDAVIDHLYFFDWTLPKRFVSVSLGFGAKRMFIFLSNKHPFPRKTFYDLIKLWIELEQNENKDIILPRDGIGCYHPLFPARSDDIWVMAGLAIKEMEPWWLNPFGPNIFAVYEQQQLNGMPAGVILKHREVF